MQVPTTNITVTLNTALTSQLLTNGTSEALLLIDEPGTNAPQLACVPSLAGQCNNLLGTGNGVGTYSGTAGRANVYQGIQNGPDSVTFFGVPFDPPGTGDLRILRATNLRGNASQLGAAGAVNAPITGSISFSSAIAVTGLPVTLAVAQSGVQSGTPVNGSFGSCNGGPIATLNPDGSTAPATFSLNMKEGFAFAFKAQGAATPSTLGALSPSSESGFIPSASAGLPAVIGGADSGTILQMYFSNIPSGVNITVPGSGTWWTSTERTWAPTPRRTLRKDRPTATGTWFSITKS